LGESSGPQSTSENGGKQKRKKKVSGTAPPERNRRVVPTMVPAVGEELPDPNELDDDGLPAFDEPLQHEFDPRLTVDRDIEEDPEANEDEEDEEAPQNPGNGGATSRTNKKQKANNPWDEVHIPLNKQAKGAPDGIYSSWYENFTGLKPGPKGINLNRYKTELDFLRLFFTDDMILDKPIVMVEQRQNLVLHGEMSNLRTCGSASPLFFILV